MRAFTIYSEILREEVAAGLGAFNIEIKLPFFLISKSCSKVPSDFISWALMPEGPRSIIFDLISGINLFKLLTKRYFDKERLLLQK